MASGRRYTQPRRATHLCIRCSHVRPTTDMTTTPLAGGTRWEWVCTDTEACQARQDDNAAARAARKDTPA